MKKFILILAVGMMCSCSRDELISYYEEPLEIEEPTTIVNDSPRSDTNKEPEKFPIEFNVSAEKWH